MDGTGKKNTGRRRAKAPGSGGSRRAPRRTSGPWGRRRPLPARREPVLTGTRRLLAEAFCLVAIFFISSYVVSCAPGTEKKQQLLLGPKHPPKAGEPPREETVPVVYTSARIAKNRFIKPQWLEIRSVPESKAPTEEGYFERMEDVVGMRAKDDIDDGVPLLKKLVEEDDIDRLSELISRGKIAIAIPTNAVTANPFLAQNDRVDVLATVQLPDANGRPRLETILLIGNARVLAVDRSFDPGPGRRRRRDARGRPIRNPYIGRKQIRAVVLEVTPQEGQMIGLVQSKGGRIRLATVGEHSKPVGDKDVRVDDSWLAAAAKLGVKVDDGRGKSRESREIEVHRGARAMFTRKWSDAALAEPYDEDADAPLFQDGRPTGVKPAAGEKMGKPEEKDLLEPLEKVDELTVELPSLPSADE